MFNVEDAGADAVVSGLAAVAAAGKGAAEALRVLQEATDALTRQVEDGGRDAGV